MLTDMVSKPKKCATGSSHQITKSEVRSILNEISSESCSLKPEERELIGMEPSSESIPEMVEVSQTVPVEGSADYKEDRK